MSPKRCRPACRSSHSRQLACARCVNRRAAGIGEQVEEVAARSQLPHHAAGDAMVEKQAGIQVVAEVHQEAVAAFLHAMEVPAGTQFTVLRLAFLLATHLQEQLLLGYLEGFSDHSDRFAQACLSLAGVHVPRCFVFLDVHPALFALVYVHCDGVLRDVCVVQAVAVDVLALQPAPQMSQVLVQAIGEHLCAVAVAWIVGRGIQWARTRLNSVLC